MAIDRPDILRLSVLGTFQAEAFVNVFHFRIDSDPAWSDTSINLLMDILDDAGTDDDSFAHIYQSMDASLHISALVGVDLRETDPISVDRSVDINGTASGNDTPAMLAAVLKWQTGFASRRRRGRSFIPGINVNMWNSTDPDRLDTTFSGSLVGRANDFVDAWLASTDYSFVVFSRVQELATPLNGEKIILGAAINPILGVQRRRRPAV